MLKGESRSGSEGVEGRTCLSVFFSILVQCVLFHAECCIRQLALVFFNHTP